MKILDDAPDIRRAMETGYAHPAEFPVCPICGSDNCEDIFTDKWGHIIGCDQCLERSSAWDCDECFGRSCYD